MEDVAALAGVSKGTLYHHFKNKQDLFLASMIDSYEESLGLFDPEVGLEDLDPRIRLEAALRGLASVLDAISSQMTVHYQAWGIVVGDDEGRDRLYGFLTQFFKDRSEEMRSVIEAGQATGVFRADADVSAITDALLALVSGFLYRSTFDPDGANSESLKACFDSLLLGNLEVSTSAESEEGGRG